MKIKFLFLFIMLFFIACKREPVHDDFSDVNNYLVQNLKLKIKKEHLYVIFSTQSCHACIYAIINVLNNIDNPKTTVLLSGYSRKQFVDIVKKIDDKIEIIYDLQNSNFSKNHLKTANSIIYSTNRPAIFKQFDYSELDTVIKIIDLRK